MLFAEALRFMEDIRLHHSRNHCYHFNRFYPAFYSGCIFDFASHRGDSFRLRCTRRKLLCNSGKIYLISDNLSSLTFIVIAWISFDTYCTVHLVQTQSVRVAIENDDLKRQMLLRWVLFSFNPLAMRLKLTRWVRFILVGVSNLHETKSLYSNYSKKSALLILRPEKDPWILSRMARSMLCPPLSRRDSFQFKFAFYNSNIILFPSVKL